MQMNTEILDISGMIVLVHDCIEGEEDLLLEAKTRGTPLTGNYSFDKHQPHIPSGDYHLHVYKKGNQIFSINKSGKGHDGYSGTRIPNDVFSALQAKFPGWKWPSDQIIESLNYTYIIEKNMREHLRKVRVPRYRLDAQEHEGFEGYFHTFADDPFLTGGNGGWINRTVAIIEKEDGALRKVPVDCFAFIDTE